MSWYVWLAVAIVVVLLVVAAVWYILTHACLDMDFTDLDLEDEKGDFAAAMEAR